LEPKETREILERLLAQAEMFQTIEEFRTTLLKEEGLEPSLIDAMTRDCKSHCVKVGAAFAGAVAFSA
jgi:hypothetical protein